jgi:hypothetical protein
MIQDQVSGKVLSEPVHINRLKMAYVRASSPQPYLLGPVVTHTTVSVASSDKHTQTDIRPNQGLYPQDPQVNDEVQEENKVAVPENRTSRGPKPHAPPERVRPCRRRTKPLRYRDSDHQDPLSVEISSMSDSGMLYKVKRVLGQRRSGHSKEYLVHFAGEPAQNSMWLPLEALNAKTQQLVKQKPPPFLT